MGDGESTALRTPDIEKTHVHAVYDAIAPHFNSTRFARWPKVASFLSSLPSGSLVVDAGCGNGKYLGLNPSCWFIGCDISACLVAIAASRGHDVAVADALLLPYRTSSVDAAISIAVLHHLSTHSRRLRAVAELARVVRPGGRLAITVWAQEQEDPSLVDKWSALPSSHDQYERTDASKELKRAYTQDARVRDKSPSGDEDVSRAEDDAAECEDGVLHEDERGVVQVREGEHEETKLQGRGCLQEREGLQGRGGLQERGGLLGGREYQRGGGMHDGRGFQGEDRGKQDEDQLGCKKDRARLQHEVNDAESRHEPQYRQARQDPDYRSRRDRRSFQESFEGAGDEYKHDGGGKGLEGPVRRRDREGCDSCNCDRGGEEGEMSSSGISGSMPKFEKGMQAKVDGYEPFPGSGGEGVRRVEEASLIADVVVRQEERSAGEMETRSLQPGKMKSRQGDALMAEMETRENKMEARDLQASEAEVEAREVEVEIREAEVEPRLQSRAWEAGDGPTVKRGAAVADRLRGGPGTAEGHTPPAGAGETPPCSGNGAGAAAQDAGVEESSGSLMKGAGPQSPPPQEYFVPWHLPYHRVEVAGAAALAGVSGAGRLDDVKGAVVYDRYYHVFVEGELERLVSQVPGMSVLSSFFDKSNWVVICEKC